MGWEASYRAILRQHQVGERPKGGPTKYNPGFSFHGLWDVCRDVSPSLNGHLDCVCHKGTDQDLHTQFPRRPVSSRGYNESCHFWE